MTTRLRKTRRLRGSRFHGWGQVAQHRASGHKGGVGKSGMLKHHFSTMLKEFPDHFGHDSSHPPHPNIIKKWVNVRDLDDLFTKFGKQEENKKVLDLTKTKYDKLLGGGQIQTAYAIKISQFKKAGGEVTSGNG